MESERRRGFVCLIVTFSLWGSLYVVSKYVLGKMPTFTISFVRFLAAFGALSFMQRGRQQKIEKSDYKYIFLIGFAGYFVAVGAQLLGTKYAGASTAALINSLNPVTMTIFGTLILKEALNKKKLFGICVALAGVYVILGHESADVGAKGIILSLFSVILWSVVSVFTRRITQKYDSLQITRYGVGVAAVFYLPVCLYELTGGAAFQADGACVLGLLYMGVICTGVGYLLWNKSLSVLEAGICSAFYPIQPLVATLLGIVLLDEAVGPAFILGAALIVAGVIINLRGSVRPGKNIKTAEADG